jgi:hypothetical protein
MSHSSLSHTTLPFKLGCPVPPTQAGLGQPIFLNQDKIGSRSGIEKGWFDRKSFASKGNKDIRKGNAGTIE